MPWGKDMVAGKSKRKMPERKGWGPQAAPRVRPPQPLDTPRDVP